MSKTLIFGVAVNCSNPALAIEQLDAQIHSGTPGYVCFLEGNLLSRLPGDPALRQALNQAALVYPDGVAVLKALHWHHATQAERVSGPSLLLQACDIGRTRGWRHFFYGGAEGVAGNLAARLQQMYPGLQVAGWHSPPFRELTAAEEQSLQERIESSDSTLLWVALGGPKQEFWMARHLGRMKVPLMLGVGAAFDFHSGQRPWAPPWIRRCGLEWLFRMFSGGGRTFRRNLVCVPKVACMLLKERCRLLFEKSK